ncbi:restriction endonuclease subunit S [Clostridium baratii]|uniref:restriction endonuclease subunit S n=1 Tax=Clostridium baratii TaxID=1561 RepID=UPI002A760825|nr:restriction endonuclease subunit S [Clostridium baratii]MDY3207196.1 restriction endonuclease subunit S [Clostridium baratii]
MEKRNVPKLRFKGFEDEWKEYKLGDLGEFKNGINKSKEDFGFGVPFINLMNVFGKNVLLNDSYGLVNATSKEIKENNLLNGDVLFIRSSVKREGVGETVLIGEDLLNTVYSGFLIRFREYNKVIFNDYKKYCFSTKKFRNNLIAKSSTSANTNINQESLKVLKLSLSSIEEQTKIADFLSNVDNIIEEQEGKVKDLEQYKKGMMQKIFEQEVRFKDENGGEYPEWEEKKLGECIVCLDNMRKPLNSTERQEMKGNIPYYGANGIVDYINDFIFDERLILLAEDGGNFDEFATRPIAQIITGKSWINNHAHVLKAKDNYIDYIFYTLVHKDIREYINGTSRAKLNKSDMLDIKIDIPCIEEQTKIANFLSNIDNIIEEEKKKLEDLKLWKKGLLQQMCV